MFLKLNKKYLKNHAEKNDLFGLPLKFDTKQLLPVISTALFTLPVLLPLNPARRTSCSKNSSHVERMGHGWGETKQSPTHATARNHPKTPDPEGRRTIP